MGGRALEQAAATGGNRLDAAQVAADAHELMGDLHAAAGRADLARAQAILIAVPTPLTENREPDLGPLVDATRSLSSVLQAGQLLAQVPGVVAQLLRGLLVGPGAPPREVGAEGLVVAVPVGQRAEQALAGAEDEAARLAAEGE